MKRLCIVAVILGAFVALPAVSAGAAPTKKEILVQQASINESLVVRMKHWVASTQEEKSSFLLGMLTMVGLENDWQHKKGTQMPFSHSLAGTWAKGLEGVPLGKMSQDLDTYAKENSDGERPVIEVLWHLYAQPHLDAQHSAKKK